MVENHTDLGKGSDQSVDREALAEKPDTNFKRQSGRPPARPPYDQYLRVSKVSK